MTTLKLLSWVFRPSSMTVRPLHWTGEKHSHSWPIWQWQTNHAAASRWRKRCGPTTTIGVHGRGYDALWPHSMKHLSRIGSKRIAAQSAW